MVCSNSKTIASPGGTIRVDRTFQVGALRGKPVFDVFCVSGHQKEKNVTNPFIVSKLTPMGSSTSNLGSVGAFFVIFFPFIVHFCFPGCSRSSELAKIAKNFFLFP